MQILVVNYNPQWPSAFGREAAKLSLILGSVPHTIHHIGSTSVPGLVAKPIIDILIDVADLSHLDRKEGEFEELDYEAKGEYGISGRRYFRKGGNKRTHHVHAFQSGDPHLTRHLAFRDYLIAHKDIAEEYGRLKLSLARSCSNMDQYCDGKDPFIQYHEREALKWYTARK